MAMTASIVMQSIFGSPSIRASKGSSANLFCPPKCVPSLRRNANLIARATYKKEDQKEKSPESTAPLNTPATPQATVKPASKVSTHFTDVLAFSGPGPERINGRLAMIGFVSAMAVELANGQDVFAQIANGGIPWFLGTSIVLSLASLIPLFKGVSAESKSDGIMSSDAELWNGRFAMLGLVALAVTEYVKGGTLV